MTLIERIRKVIDDSELSSAAFADKIGVQRSSISHILSGRNKPSLDFVLKVLHAFPTLNSNWLLLGKEDLQTQHMDDTSSLFTSKQPEKPSVEQPDHPLDSKKFNFDKREVKHVTVFYTDGTCSTYTNKN